MNDSESVEGKPTRDERLQLLRDQYDIARREYRLRDGDPITLYAIADPDAMLDDDRLLEASHEQLPWHPYWVHAGAAALLLAEQLHGRRLDDIAVLDLGCGLGLTTVAAARQGAIVLACDHAPPAVEFTRLNAHAYLGGAVRAERFDWRTDSLDQRFPLILGSDVLYNRADLPHLNRLWRSSLAPGGEVWLADPNRPLTRDLLRQLPTAGWHVRSEIKETTEGPARLSVLTPVTAQ